MVCKYVEMMTIRLLLKIYYGMIHLFGYNISVNNNNDVLASGALLL